MEITKKVLVIDDLNQESLKLRSPQGKILHKESLFSAYSKENLGSIPRDSENILVRNRRPPKKGFLSYSHRFPVMTSTINLNPGPGAYQVNNSQNTKNVKFCKADRFDETKEFYDKYYPGPCDYKTEVSSMSDSNTTRFSSLYNSKPTLCLKKQETLPGPGYYSQSINKKDDRYTYNNIFLSKTKKSFFDKVGSQFFEAGRYYKETELIKNSNKLSHFFLSEIPTRRKEIEEALNINNQPEKPGPGSYNLIKDWSRPPLVRSLETKPIEVGDEPVYTILDNNNNSNINFMNKKEIKRIPDEPKIPIYDKNIAKCAFDSETNRFPHSGNHVPGPLYYHPEEIKFNNFNSYMNKKWI